MKSNTLNCENSIREANSGHEQFHDERETAQDQCGINRRTFCNGLLLSSSVVIVGTSFAETISAQDSVLAYPPVKIEGAEKLIIGSALNFEYPTRNDPAILLRSAEGEYTAFSRKCSHAGCSVEFDAARRCLSCPCHRGAFDRRVGYVMHGPPQRPLDQIVLQVRRGGEVWAVGKCRGNYADKFAVTLEPDKYLSRSYRQ